MSHFRPAIPRRDTETKAQTQSFGGEAIGLKAWARLTRFSGAEEWRNGDSHGVRSRLIAVVSTASYCAIHDLWYTCSVRRHNSGDCRWTRFLPLSRLRVLGLRRQASVHAIGTYAVQAIPKHTNHTHAEVLQLIDELLALGPPPAAQLPRPVRKRRALLPAG